MVRAGVRRGGFVIACDVTLPKTACASRDDSNRPSVQLDFKFFELPSRFQPTGGFGGGGRIPAPFQPAGEREGASTWRSARSSVSRLWNESAGADIQSCGLGPTRFKYLSGSFQRWMHSIKWPPPARTAALCGPYEIALAVERFPARPAQATAVARAVVAAVHGAAGDQWLANGVFEAIVVRRRGGTP